MQEDNWNDYRFVLALYRRGSIVSAARELGVNETTVVRRLSYVERFLGTRLFVRKRGRVTPTDAAESVIRRLIRIDDQFRSLHDEASGADRRIAGSVSVTAVPIVANRVVIPKLPNFLARHRELEIDLVVDSAVLGITRSRDADIAIRGARPSTDLDAITRKLGVMTYGLYCHRDLVGLEDPLPWIAYSRRQSDVGRPHAKWIEERMAEEGSTPRTRVNDGETLLQCVVGGLGQTLLADALARRFPSLVRLDASHPPPSRELWMLMHPCYRDVQRIDVVAVWLAEMIHEFLGFSDSIDL